MFLGFQYCCWETWCHSDYCAFIYILLFFFLEAFRIFFLPLVFWNLKVMCVDMCSFSSVVMGTQGAFQSLCLISHLSFHITSLNLFFFLFGTPVNWMLGVLGRTCNFLLFLLLCLLVLVLRYFLDFFPPHAFYWIWIFNHIFNFQELLLIFLIIASSYIPLLLFCNIFFLSLQGFTVCLF